MFALFVALCLTSQAFGATLFSNDGHGKEYQKGVFGKAVAHSDGEGNIKAESKDYEYAYEKAAKSAHNDGKKVVNGEGYGHPHDVKVVYNNDFEQSYERGVGSGHKDSYEHDYKFNNDVELKDSNIASVEKYGYDIDSGAFPHGLYKRSPSSGFPAYNYNHYGYGHHGYPAYHGYNGFNGIHKRSPSSGFPAYNYNHYGYGYHGYPAFNGYHGIHKRSVGYNGYNNFNHFNNYGYPVHGNHFGFRFFH